VDGELVLVADELAVCDGEGVNWYLDSIIIHNLGKIGLL
jgi:hypothetical protein